MHPRYHSDIFSSYSAWNCDASRDAAPKGKEDPVYRPEEDEAAFLARFREHGERMISMHAWYFQSHAVPTTREDAEALRKSAVSTLRPLGLQ